MNFAVLKLACAHALLEQNAISPDQATALLKRAEVAPGTPPISTPQISHEEAEKSLTRLKGLDTSSWTGEQARRGAAVGAIAAPVLSVAQRAVAGDPILGSRVHGAIKDFKGLPSGGGGRLRALAKIPALAARNLAGSALAGAVTGGAMPVIKHEVEREAERGKLRKYIAQEGTPKIASEKNKKDDSGFREYGKGIALSAGGLVGQQASGLAMNSAVSKAHEADHVPGGLYDSVKSKAGKVPVHEQSGVGPLFMPKKIGPLAYLPGMRMEHGVHMPAFGPNTAAVLAHELGHSDIDSKLPGRLLQTPSMLVKGVGSQVATGAGLYAGLTGDKDLKRKALWGSALSAAPNLAAEAGASVNALRRLHGVGASKKQLLSAVGQLAPAFGTYAGDAVKRVGGVYGGYGMGTGIRHIRESRAAKKAADA